MTSQPCACALTRGTRSAGKSSSSESYSSASHFWEGNVWPLGHFNCTPHFQGLRLRVYMHSGADASKSALALCQEQMHSSCFQSLQYLNKKPHSWIATPAATAASPSLCIALSSPFILFRPKLQHFLLFRCCAYYILIASFVLCEFKHTLLFVQCRF